MPKNDKSRSDFVKEITEALSEIRSGLTADELDEYEDALAEVTQSELGVTFVKPVDDRPEDSDS